MAVDTRSDLPGGPAVHVLSFEDVFTDDFRRRVEAGFARLLQKEGAGLIEMIGLPQEVETLVRTESMKRVIKNLNHAAGITSSELEGGIGVLFFARGLLAIEPEQLESAMRELFGESLSSSQIDRLESELKRLISDEQAAESRIKQKELSQLITGEPGSFVTLWQSKRS